MRITPASSCAIAAMRGETLVSASPKRAVGCRPTATADRAWRVSEARPRASASTTSCALLYTGVASSTCPRHISGETVQSTRGSSRSAERIAASSVDTYRPALSVMISSSSAPTVNWPPALNDRSASADIPLMGGAISTPRSAGRHHCRFRRLLVPRQGAAMRLQTRVRPAFLWSAGRTPRWSGRSGAGGPRDGARQPPRIAAAGLGRRRGVGRLRAPDLRGSCAPCLVRGHVGREPPHPASTSSSNSRRTQSSSATRRSIHLLATEAPCVTTPGTTGPDTAT